MQQHLSVVMRYRHHDGYHPVRIVRSETFVVSSGTIKVLAFLIASLKTSFNGDWLYHRI